MRKIVAAVVLGVAFLVAAGCGGSEEVCTCTCTCDDGTKPPISGAKSKAECDASCDTACDPGGWDTLWECSSMTE